MAKPETARFGKFLVKLGSGTGPIVYAAPCGFTSKSLTLSKDLTEIVIPDCEDPDAASWVGRDVNSLSAAVNGQGVLASEALETWTDAYDSVEPVPVKIEIHFKTKILSYTGTMHISSLSFETEQGGRVTITVEMASDGEMVKAITPVVP